MPPSPIVKLVVNEPVYERLLKELQIHNAPTVEMRTERSGGLRGQFDPGRNRVLMYLGHDTYDHESLGHLQTQLVRTFLHEIRHAWQQRHWSAAKWEEDEAYPYYSKPSEVDARDFADRKIADYRGVVRVSRTFPSSGFSRLSAAGGKR